MSFPETPSLSEIAAALDALCCTDRTGSEIRLLRHFSERLRAIECEHASPGPEAGDYVYGSGGSEIREDAFAAGQADVASRLRSILDPTDDLHLDLDGLLRRVSMLLPAWSIEGLDLMGLLARVQEYNAAIHSGGVTDIRLTCHFPASDYKIAAALRKVCAKSVDGR